MKKKRTALNKNFQKKKVKKEKLSFDVNVLLLILSLIPLFYAALFQGGYFPWEVYATLLLSLPAITLFLYLKIVKSYPLRKSGADNGLLLFLGVAFISLFFTVYFHATLTEFYKALIYLFLFYIALDCISEKKEFYIAVYSFLIIGFILSALGILAYAGYRFHLQSGIFKFALQNGFVQGARVASTLQYANTFAAFVILPFFISFSFTIKAKKIYWKVFYAVLSVFFLIAFFLTESRGGLIAIVISWIIYLLLLRKADRKEGILYTLSLIAIFFAFALLGKGLFSPATKRIGERLKALFEFFSGKKSRSLGQRENMLKDSLKILKAHPIFGTGNGTYQYVYMKYRSVYFFSKFPHSIFFQVLDELGIIGGIAFLYMLYGLIRKGIKTIFGDYDVLLVGLFSGLLSILIHAFMDFDWSLMFMPMLFFFGFGVLLSQTSKKAYFEFKCPIKGSAQTERKNYKVKKSPVKGTIAVVIITSFMFALFILPFSAARADFDAKKSLGSVPWQKTVSEFKTAVSIDPLAAEYHYDLAHFYFNTLIPRSSNPQVFVNEAVSQYKEAIRRCPEFFLYHYELAKLYLQTGNKEAIDQFTKSVELNPMDPGGHAALGFAYLKLNKDTVMAKTQFEEALKLDPKNPDAHLGMGSLYEELGDTTHAIAEYKLAVKYNNKNAYAYYRLGVLYEKRNDLPDAVRNLFYAIHYNPSLKEAKAEFEKFAPILTIVQPTLNEKVKIGGTVKIQWITSNNKNVQYYNLFLIPQRGKWIAIKSGIKNNINSFVWKVPGNLKEGKYKIRLYAVAPNFMQRRLGGWLSYGETNISLNK